MKSYIRLLLALALFATLFTGCAVTPNVDESPYVSAVGQVQTHGDVSLTLESVCTDTLAFYARLAVSGKGFSKRSAGDGAALCDQIRQVQLVTEDGARWDCASPDGQGQGTLPLAKEGQTDTETVVVFGSGFDHDTRVQLTVYLAEGEPFVFDDVPVTAPPAVTRDLSADDFTIRLDGAVGHIQKIIYTPLRTRFEIAWTYEAGFVPGNVMKVYQMAVESDGQREACFFYPNDLNGTAGQSVQREDVFLSLSPEKPLAITMYTQPEGRGLWDGALMNTLVQIPPSELPRSLGAVTNL